MRTRFTLSDLRTLQFFGQYFPQRFPATAG